MRQLQYERSQVVHYITLCIQQKRNPASLGKLRQPKSDNSDLNSLTDP